MNNRSRNRSHPNYQLEQQILKSEICHSVINEIQDLVIQYASDFDFDFLSDNNDYHLVPLVDAISELYNKTRLKFKKSNIGFDNHWVKNFRKTHTHTHCYLIATMNRIGFYLGEKQSHLKVYQN